MSVPFTFGELHRRTTKATGTMRMAVFDRLPEELQAQAWAELGRRCGEQARSEWDVPPGPTGGDHE